MTLNDAETREWSNVEGKKDQAGNHSSSGIKKDRQISGDQRSRGEIVRQPEIAQDVGQEDGREKNQTNARASPRSFMRSRAGCERGQPR